MALTLGGTSGIVGAGITTLDASGLSVTGVVTTTALDSSSSQKFTIGGTERARIHSDGKVGINSTAPSNLFTIESTSNNQFAIKSDDSNADIVLADTGGSARVRHTGTTFEIWTGGAAGSYFAQSSARRMQIDSSGNTTLNTGNLVIGTSGKGIDFSATSDGSGTDTSELFDDYEEGTWTPNIRNDGTTATWTTQQGKYVKIGQQVTVWLNADGGSVPRSGGTSSSLIMTGLPYEISMFGNPILGIVGANNSVSSGLYSTAGLILNVFGQGSTQVRFGCGGQEISFGINYCAGCFTYTAST